VTHSQLMAMLSKLTPEQLANATPEQFERLQALLEAERSATVSEFEDPREPLEEFIARTMGREVLTQSAARPMSWPPGEQPDLATFIASFAPVMPAKPKPETKATIADTPDIATRVPPQRRPRLLQDVIERTQQAMEEDRLALYRRGPVDLDGGGFTDE
jgi:hypothetical protein